MSYQSRSGLLIIGINARRSDLPLQTFDGRLHTKGYVPMSGQIVDASLVPAPKQRNTDGD